MRYCMFCGEQIPDKAVFCPSCGARQPEQEQKEKPVIQEIEEDDSDNIALTLLSKANFASKKNSSGSIIPQYEQKKPEKKAKKVDENGKVIKPVVKEEVKINNSIPSIKKIEEQKHIVPEVQIHVKYDEEMDEEDALMMARMMEMMDRGSDSYTPPILEDITEEIAEQKVAENYEQLTKKQEETANETEAVEPVSTKTVIESKEEIVKPLDTKKEDLIEETKSEEVVESTKRERRSRTQRTTKPIYKKRNLSEEDESENDEPQKRTMSTSSTITDDTDGLTADEIADLEKYKKYKESGEAKKDEDLQNNSYEGRTPRGEGRKKTNGRKKEIRRNIDKEIAERDIRDIEHEEVEKKNDVDKDYDGYYENVKPIDFDKMHDNSAMVKTIITGAAVIAMASTIFYFVITFFLQ